MTVIATFKLNYPVARGRGAGHSQSTHYRFRSGRDKTEHLYPGQARRNPFRQLKRIWFAGPKAPGGRDRFLHHFGDVRIAMAQHQRTKALAEIDVLAPIDRRHGATLSTAKEHRRAANSFERTHRTVHATGRHARGALKVFAREIECLLFRGHIISSRKLDYGAEARP